MLIIKNSARRRLEMALEFDELADYIIGGPLYAIYANDGAGGKVRSVMYPVETIYETHREHPELELDRRFYEGLKAYFVRTDNPCRVYAGVQAIEYQMRAECGCSAAFHVDCLDLLETVKQNLIRESAWYRSCSTKEYEEFEDQRERSMLSLLEEQQESIHETVESYRKYLQENRG